MLIIHILVALTSLIVAGYTSFFPSVNKLRATYALVFATLGTGTHLVFTRHTNMLATCIEGLVYIAVVTLAIAYSTRKLSKVENK